MPEIRRQNGQAAFDVLTGPVPLDQRLDGKSVSKIVQTRAVAVRSPTQPDLAGEIVKRAPDFAAVQPGATAGHEEHVRPSCQETITLRGIVREHCAGRRMNRYQPRLAKL